MAPMKKRPAASAAGGARKKPAVADSPADKCRVISSVVLATAGYPKPVLQNLAGYLGKSLGVCKEERNKFQQEVATMVGEVLAAAEKALEEKVTAAEAKVASGTTDRESRDAALEAAKTTLATKRDAVAAAMTESAEAGTAQKAAKQAFATAEAAQKAGDADLEAAAGKKERLESLLKGTYEALKTGGAEPAAVRAGCSEVCKVGKEHQLDASLLQSLPSALTKAPDARGTFDTLCLTQVEGEFKSRVEALAATLADGEAGKAERAQATADAGVALAAADEKEQSCKASLSGAQAEEKEAEEALKAATKEVNNCLPELKQNSDVLDAAKASLQDLKNGALKAYQELLELSNAPPPEPEPEEKAPAAATESAPPPAATEAPAAAEVAPVAAGEAGAVA